MNKKAFAIALVFAAAWISGCTTTGNITSIHREFDATKGQSQWVDAKQRLVLVATDTKAPGGAIVCAEPSPDALATYAASLSGNASYANVSAGVTASIQEQAISLAQRTAAIQLLRDQYYRLCESYFSGEIDRWTYDVMLRRTATNAIAYLAIDQLTAAMGQQGKSAQTQPATPKGGANGDKPGSGSSGKSKPKNGNKGSQQKPGSVRYMRRDGSDLPTIMPISYTTYVERVSDTNSTKCKTGSAAACPSKPNGKHTKPITPAAPDDKGNGNNQANNEGTGDNKQQPTSQPMEAVADTVDDIVNGIIRSDYSVSMCFSYYADGQPNPPQKIKDFCDASLDAAKAEKQLPTAEETAYSTDCTGADAIKDKAILSYCAQLLAALEKTEPSENGGNAANAQIKGKAEKGAMQNSANLFDEKISPSKLSITKARNPLDLGL